MTNSMCSGPFVGALDSSSLGSVLIGFFRSSLGGLFATVGLRVSDSIYRIIALLVSVVSGMDSKHHSSGIWCKGMAMAGDSVS